MASALTVTGYGGAAQTLIFADIFDSAYSAALSLLPGISASVVGRSYVVGLPGSLAPTQAGATGLLQVTDGGIYALPTGYSALIDSATVPATIFGGNRDGQRVVAGSGGLVFNAGQGAGTVVAGDGANYISVLQGAGAQTIVAGNGNNTVVAVSGNSAVTTGSGSNLILAQGGK